MAITITTVNTDDHAAVLNLGTQELNLRHLSDDQIVLLRITQATTENARDITGEVVTDSN